jgi:hypothetical protein
MRMHPYTITDHVTGEKTKLIAPNRDAAMKAYVKRRLVVTRDEPKAAPATAEAAEQWTPEELHRIARPGTPLSGGQSGTGAVS